MSNEPTLNNSHPDWQRLDAMVDKDIDLSDCPEVMPEMFARGIVRRGLSTAKTKTQLGGWKSQ